MINNTESRQDQHQNQFQINFVKRQAQPSKHHQLQSQSQQHHQQQFQNLSHSQLEERHRKEQHLRHQLQQQLQHSDRQTHDWVKPPHHKGAWYTFHDPHRLLQYFLQYADKVNGPVFNTINIAVAAPESEEFQLKLSPMCASGQEDLGIFLPAVTIRQLGLVRQGDYETRSYGRVSTFSGLLLRVESPRCSGFVYRIPDGYVYELPDIFSSAALACTTHNGNPQRQGILHRELLYQHALVCYNRVLHCLSDELYNSSGIPEVMFRNARCEVLHYYSTGKNGQQKRPTKINLNITLRRMSQQGELDEVHPCFLNDFFIKEVIAPPFVYHTAVPRCFQCQKTHHLFYCQLCRKRLVQTPHVYCSKVCQQKHWASHHCAFHLLPSSEQRVDVKSLGDVRQVEMQTNADTSARRRGSISYDDDDEDNNSFVFAGGGGGRGLTKRGAGSGLSWEQMIAAFLLFYGCFWFVLKCHADDENEL